MVTEFESFSYWFLLKWKQKADHYKVQSKENTFLFSFSVITAEFNEMRTISVLINLLLNKECIANLILYSIAKFHFSLLKNEL